MGELRSVRLRFDKERIEEMETDRWNRWSTENERSRIIDKRRNSLLRKWEYNFFWGGGRGEEGWTLSVVMLNAVSILFAGTESHFLELPHH